MSFAIMNIQRSVAYLEAYIKDTARTTNIFNICSLKEAAEAKDLLRKLRGLLADAEGIVNTRGIELQIKTAKPILARAKPFVYYTEDELEGFMDEDFEAFWDNDFEGVLKTYVSVDAMINGEKVKLYMPNRSRA